MILINGHVVDLVFVVALMLVVVFVSYLLIMIGLSQYRRESWTPRDMSVPGATDYDVIFMIPCLNEESVVGASIQRLLGINYPRLHVLVIDDGSDDGTADVVRSFDDPRVHLLQRTLPFARQGKGIALNAALKHIFAGNVVEFPDPEKTIVVVVDADGRMDVDSLDYVIPRFDDPELGGAQIGVRINNRHTNLLARLQDFEFVIYTQVFQRGRMRLGSVGLGGNGQFVRLSALGDLGDDPWTDSLTEDLDLGLRIALSRKKIEFCPDVAVHQQGLVSISRWIKQRARWFQGHLQAWSHLPDVLTKLHGIRRVDLAYHITSPFILLVGSLFTAAFLLWGAGLLISIVTGDAEFSFFWISAYIFSFGPMTILGFIYQKSEEELTRFRAVLIGHLYVTYSVLWMLAGWLAIFRIVTRKKGWAKTARLVENQEGIAEGSEEVSRSGVDTAQVVR